MERFFINAIVTIILFICMASCVEKIYNKYGIQPDNVVEELLEDAIQAHTGVELEFTPD